jgi:hypothetical protein
MDQSGLLHQMCDDLLAAVDIKAICKNRGLPVQATSSRPLLESLFLSDTGVAAALATLDRTEIALLHLLHALGKSVDVSFFGRLDPPKKEPWSYPTFTQRFQGVFAKVKERLVRRGLLLMGLAPDGFYKKTNMERWEFAFPVQFARHLPPLLESPKSFDGEGDWRSNVAREKLKTGVGQLEAGETGDDKLEIANRELRFGGQPFSAGRLLGWQQRRWQAETTTENRKKTHDEYALPPTEAAMHILATLGPGQWSDADSLATPLHAFCGFQVDSGALCESGWRWGCLARQQFEGKTWYRLAPTPQDADVPPDRYLDVLGDDSVAVDLDNVPFDALEKLVTISEQRPAPGRGPALLIAPNLVKLGRAAEKFAAWPLADWLEKNSPAFHQAIDTLRQRRGKTVLHENLLVARVNDLALKVAIEKAMGNRIVSLGEDAVAFPCDAVTEVTRVVAKSGHVVKEVSHRGS